MIVAALITQALGAPAAGATDRPAWPADTLAMPVYREIGDWVLGCDNTRRCAARYVFDETSGASAGDGDPIGLTIARAGRDGAFTVEIVAPSPFDPGAIRIDGKAFAGAGWVRSADRTEARLAGAAATRFVRVIVDAQRLVLAEGMTISLKGLAAIRLAMDEAQRGGGVLPDPVVQVRPAGPLPGAVALAARVRRAQAALLRRHDCDLASGQDDEAAALDAKIAIVLIGCGRFAYQTSSIVFRVDRQAPYAATPLILPPPPIGEQSDDPNTAGEYVSPVFDRATATLTELSKGRGWADCGSTTSWTFDGTGFRLSAFDWQRRCGGLPGAWSAIYRSEIRPLR
ncbi:hypothetical protein ASG67_00120 [Sphingomonas sp. Leaf339]|uniref:DUF1176 domain-containing protein n=1 Tax=Sphingomonas sp. Leaf339 TaxID=1736343 RepID=UPI0006FA27DF|nr:DUF1176 domain-containing protein [Sphingomonas sp. Leaf339]KQU61642.1 hypothetical protein ASG67_00120 [Sphingomonas sp. Leaf339]